MRHLWILSLALSLPLLLWGCPAEPPADDDDDSATDDDTGDDDTQGDDDAGDDDASDDDTGGGDDDSGDDDDSTPNPDAPVISNCQVWVEYDPKYQLDALLLSVDYTDPQGDLAGGDVWVKTVDINGFATAGGGPHNIPDGPSGTFESFAAFVGEDFGLPPGYTVTVDIRISDGEMFWSNELSTPYLLP
jgi:hypothetical protein